MSEAAPLEADRVGDLPHPRETAALYGQEAAEAAFLGAWASGRLHHAWLIHGPRGVGKATLAYRIARARLLAPEEGGLFGPAEPPATLDTDPDDPLARRIAAGSEPRIFTLRRELDDKGERLRTQIRVEDVRKLKGFFQLSAADGGWRVAIVDPAEEMNASAANALLKLLEEPPAKALFLLVSHAPARLLPTIRSRTVALGLRPLGAEALEKALAGAGVGRQGPIGPLALLSGGAAGEAARMALGDGPALYARLLRLVSAAPGMNRREMWSLSQACMGRAAAETYDLTLRLLDLLLVRLARAGAAGGPEEEAAPGEAAALRALAPDQAAARVWAEAAARLSERASGARAVNLDPAETVFDILAEIDAAARAARARSVP